MYCQDYSFVSCLYLQSQFCNEWSCTVIAWACKCVYILHLFLWENCSVTRLLHMFVMILIARLSVTILTAVCPPVVYSRLHSLNNGWECLLPYTLVNRDKRRCLIFANLMGKKNLIQILFGTFLVMPAAGLCLILTTLSMCVATLNPPVVSYTTLSLTVFFFLLFSVEV